MNKLIKSDSTITVNCNRCHREHVNIIVWVMDSPLEIGGESFIYLCFCPYTEEVIYIKEKENV